MDIDRYTRMMQIVADPELRAVMEWYGLPTEDRALYRMTLQDVCYEFEVDIEDLLVELVLGAAESEDYEEEDDWLPMH